MENLRDPFSVHLANTLQQQRAVQRLRYDVFVRELGAAGPLVDHTEELEQDRFDPFADHMVVRHDPSDRIVGAYRLLRSDQAARAGQFYSESEYDLSRLRATGRPLLELGRSCIHKDFRTGLAMHRLWTGLASYIAAHRIEILFGVASFHGIDPAPLAGPLSLLHHRHLAPPALRVRARADAFQRMDLIPKAELDRRAAILQTPALIKAYLRLGGCVGEGAYVDRAFNTTDVCLILDVATMNPRQARLYQGQPE
jgi:putative hemolysin